MRFGCLPSWLAALAAVFLTRMCECVPPTLISTPTHSPLSNVLGSILHSHFRQPYATTLIILRGKTEVGHGALHDLLSVLLLAPEVRGELVIQLNEEKPKGKLPRLRRLWSHVLLLAEDYEALNIIYALLTPKRFDFAGHYLLALTGPGIGLTTVDRIFHDLWLRQIVNVVVALPRPVNATVQLWTYYPYSPGLCRVPKPVLLLTWPVPPPPSGFFFPRKNARFHGCPLKVGTFESRPFTVLTGDPGAPTLGGFEGDLVASIAHQLDFTVSLRIAPHSQQWGIAAFANSTGLMRMIYSEEVDLGVGCLGVSPERSAMLKPGKVHFTTELVIVVPAGRAYTSFEKLFQPFSAPLWAALLSCIGLGLLTLGVTLRWPIWRRHYLTGWGVSSPSLNLLRLICASPLSRLPTGSFARTLLALWLLLCHLLQLLYQGSLFTFLQQSTHRPPMSSLAEIDATGALYHIAGSARRFFEPFPHRFARLRLFPPAPDSIGARLNWVGAHPYDTDVTMCTRDHVAHYNLRHRHLSEGRRLWIAREPMALYAVTLLYPRHSMLPSAFDKLIERIESAGLLKYWAARYGDYHFFEGGLAAIEPTAPIRLEQLSGVFEMLLGMFGASGLVLLAELGWERRGRLNFNYFRGQ